MTSFVDTGLTNGTTYYYKVSAESANGEGPLSNEATVDPGAVAAPDEPLPVVDDFDRGFENPLSDAGRWSNGVNGSGETGLYVPSTWLACSRSTTCTSWRNAAQYGPDVEVWARIGTLPGDNNHIRLNARLQGVGHFDLRRLHAAHEPACRNRPDLGRTHRQRHLRQPVDDQPGARRRRHPAPARQGLDARGLAPPQLGLVATRCRHGRDLRVQPAASVSGCAARSVGSTTSVRARWVRRHPTPSRRAHRAP